MKASMLTKMFAVITCINLAALPVYAQEVTLGDHTIDVTGIETVCDHPELLDGAISETYNELLAENPEVAEFFTQEVTELAETVADAPLEDATVEVVETVAGVAPQLVQSITQTQEGTVNAELATTLQGFLTTAPEFLSNQPELVSMLTAVDKQLDFVIAKDVIESAGFKDMGSFFEQITKEGGASPDAMMNAAREIFAQNGGDFMPMFEQGAPAFILEQCETMGNFFEIMETHGQELFAGGDFDPARMQEVVGASFEVTPEMMAMMKDFADGMDFQPGEFPSFSPEMFMDHVFEGGGDYSGFPMMEGDHPWGPEGMPEGMDPSVMGGPEIWGMDPSQFDPSQMDAFFHEMDQQMQDQFQQEWEQTNDQIVDRNQDFQQQMQDRYNSPVCVEHRAAGPHDPSGDGHMGC